MHKRTYQLQNVLCLFCEIGYEQDSEVAEIMKERTEKSASRTKLGREKMQKHRRMSKLCFALFLAGIFLGNLGTGVLFSSGVEPATADNVYVAVNRQVTTQSLSMNELKRIFLGKQRLWADGTRVRLAMLDVDSTGKEFLKTVTGRSPGQFRAHWRNIVFSGRGVMPRFFNSEKELQAYITDSKGAIGNIPRVGTINQFDVNIISITEKDKYETL